MSHAVELTTAARRELRKIQRPDRSRLEAAIRALREDPRPPRCRKLTGRDEAWRVRVGNYRIVYEVYDDRLVVVVVRLGHRREVY